MFRGPRFIQINHVQRATVCHIRNRHISHNEPSHITVLATISNGTTICHKPPRVVGQVEPGSERGTGASEGHDHREHEQHDQVSLRTGPLNTGETKVVIFSPSPDLIFAVFFAGKGCVRYLLFA